MIAHQRQFTGLPVASRGSVAAAVTSAVSTISTGSDFYHLDRTSAFRDTEYTDTDASEVEDSSDGRCISFACPRPDRQQKPSQFARVRVGTPVDRHQACAWASDFSDSESDQDFGHISGSEDDEESFIEYTADYERPDALFELR